MPEPFLIDAYGQFPPGRLCLHWYDEPRPPAPALDALIAETWQAQVEARRQAGGILFNGQLARYLRHRVQDGCLSIDVGPTDYANFMSTNLLNHHRGDEWGWELFSNPIGTSATLMTADGWILLGRRNDRVAWHAGYVHNFGGGLEAGERRADGSIDGFESIQRELREELALRPEDTTRMVCLGLIRDPTIRQPELIFDVHLCLRREDLAGRLNPDDPHEEHTATLACRNAPEAILPFIRSNTPITPVAVGALCLHGRHAFGEAWYQRTIDELVDAM